MYSPFYPGSFGGQMFMPQPQPMFMGGMQPQFQGFQQPSYNPSPPSYNPPPPSYNNQSFNQMYYSQQSYPMPSPHVQQSRPAFPQHSGGYSTIQQPNYQPQRPMLVQSPSKFQSTTVQVPLPQAPTPPQASEDQFVTSVPAAPSFQPQTIRVPNRPQGGNEGGPPMTIQVAKAPAARVVSRSNPQILADILAGKGASIQQPKVRMVSPEPAQNVRAAPPPPQTPDNAEPIIAKATPQDPPLKVDENGNPKPNKPAHSPILKPSTPTGDDEIPSPVDDKRVSFQETGRDSEKDDRISRGVCGGCAKNVYSDEKRMKSEDGTYFHSDCYNRLVASNANASSPQSM
mmetsp:Transcript_45518/g.107944  ORF Transcript_45518/g.107944 Transcript_45518/m.107944 type:complete len:343 (+) Transcript_45518:57-1085(+)|eukprot:CAMPEP_0177692400 /NCGR_PEP_ID=MMETSP0484_2-20121128/1833_1 /TAXON_ID=354590 /ORGANISM="Rhodomonas lens, Strain RHODO" /LENGTH=342 /DNA_ID=CAMNT_0019203115 /DNA_START=133 /DNA_END=1161 /DNA_ORIENTATION=+